MISPLDGPWTDKEWRTFIDANNFCQSTSLFAALKEVLSGLQRLPSSSTNPLLGNLEILPLPFNPDHLGSPEIQASSEHRAGPSKAVAKDAALGQKILDPPGSNVVRCRRWMCDVLRS
jgi:hypothetical protein